MNKKKPVLIIQHAPHEHPAALLRALQTQGIPTLWIHPYRSDLFPDVQEIAGVISLGGPMGANDEKDHPWITQELKLLQKAYRAGLPIAGICLGGQLLAKALGAKVEKNQKAEVGWFSIELNTIGRTDAVIGSAGSNPLVYHWHMDTFYLPNEAELLGSSAICPRQAYRIGDRVYGFQFHPEADHQLVDEWLQIPGVDEEIAAEQKIHGENCVQDAQTQRKLAVLGETTNLKITAGIGQLFQLKAYEPAREEIRQFLKEMYETRWEIEVFLENNQDHLTVRKGTIVSLLTIPKGEFLILKDHDAVLWPIRLDYAKTITPVSK